ncbi:MAG: SpoIIE family protein phosphatase, partial [Frankia sp.]|nr:SpoIIE family protein phosphatase [Frankia sp.]
AVSRPVEDAGADASRATITGSAAAGAPAARDGPAAVGGPAEATPAEPRYRVHLGDVSTELLLAAKSHVDNLVREFTLVAAGATDGELPAPLADLIVAVTTRFAEAREAIRRQALAAAAAGARRTELDLWLPVSAAQAGEDYLKALDKADQYARAARLLTLEAPPEHQAFRHWYVSALVAQLRAASRGERPSATPSFEDYLLRLLSEVSAASRASGRAARLQAVTALLASATRPEQVATAVLSEGVGALGASGGSLLTPHGEELLSVPGSLGYSTELVAQLRAERRDAALPAAEAIREGHAVWLESVTEHHGRFPGLRDLEPRTVSLCALPLRAGGEILGALRFSFDHPRLFGPDDREFATALAAQAALALERARLIAAERQARERVTFLATATERLTARLDERAALRQLVTLLAPALAEYAAVYLVGSDRRLRLVAEAGAVEGGGSTLAPADAAVGGPGAAGATGPLERPDGGDGPGVPAGRLDPSRVPVIRRALECGCPVVATVAACPPGQTVPEAVEVAGSARPPMPHRDTTAPDQPAAARRSGPTAHLPTGVGAVLAVPLRVHGETIGVLGLCRSASDPPFSLDEQSLVEDVVDRAAVALVHSRQYRQERETALTLQRSLLPRRMPTVPGVTFAWRYLPAGVGALVGGDWYDVLPLDDGRIALVIGDVMGRGIQAAATMGQLRATARAHAAAHLPAAAVFLQLDAAVSRLEQEQITTAAMAVLDPAARELRVTSAGHLPPLVVPAEGEPRFVEVEPGPPLGAGLAGDVQPAPYAETIVPFAPGSILLLYTDGLVEDRHRSADAGMATLRSVAAGAAGSEELCDRALAALARGSGHDDDTALLAVSLSRAR